MGRVDEILGLGGARAAAGASAARPMQVGVTASTKLSRVAIDRLVPDPHNVRRELVQAEVEELADSMRVAGLLQPIRARWSTSLSAWQVVAGHKRLAAAKLLGWAEVDVICYALGVSDEDILRDQLTENLVRSDPDKLSQARRMDELRQLTGCTMEELGARLGLHKGTVSRYLSLLKPAEQSAPVGKPQARRARGGSRPLSWVHRSGRGRLVRVEGRPADDVVQLLEAALAEARGQAATRAA